MLKVLAPKRKIVVALLNSPWVKCISVPILGHIRLSCYAICIIVGLFLVCGSYHLWHGAESHEVLNESYNVSGLLIPAYSRCLGVLVTSRASEILY